MLKTVFDLEVLEKTGEIEAIAAAAAFGSQAAYAAAYDKFIAGSSKHMQFLPDVIVYVDVTRELFLKEVAIIQKELRRLGMNKTALMLDDLTDATNNGVSRAVSDRIVQYRAMLEMFKKAAAEASRQEELPPVVLAVDDMPEILTEITDILEPDYTVICAANAEDAWAAADLHMPDVFLLDIEMPGENGVVLAGNLRRNPYFVASPLLFLTSSQKREHVMSAKGLGSKGYILKPINAAYLKEQLKTICT